MAIFTNYTYLCQPSEHVVRENKLIAGEISDCDYNWKNSMRICLQVQEELLAEGAMDGLTRAEV